MPRSMTTDALQDSKAALATDEDSRSSLEADAQEVRRRIGDQAFRDQVVRALWRVGGTACAGDLANELPEPVPAHELLPVLDAMVEEGPLRKKPQDADPAHEDSIYGTIYRIAR